MTCEELRPDYLLYTIGTLAEPESSEIREHLDRGCPACTEGLRQAQALAYSMGAALPGPEPPRELRDRVVSIAAPSRVPFWNLSAWQAWTLAAACIALAIVPTFLWLRYSSQLASQQSGTEALLARERAAAAGLRDQIAKLQTGSPVRAVPIFALELERGGEAAPKQLAVPRNTAVIVLALPSDLVRQASAADVRDASGQTVRTVSPLPVSDADSTGLTIDAQMLSTGRYTVVLLAHDRTLARFPFEVTLR